MLYGWLIINKNKIGNFSSLSTQGVDNSKLINSSILSYISPVLKQSKQLATGSTTPCQSYGSHIFVLHPYIVAPISKTQWQFMHFLNLEVMSCSALTDINYAKIMLVAPISEVLHAIGTVIYAYNPHNGCSI